ncbi:COQ9 family protein [Rhodovarius crocodyli]|uniref:COQ9 family protein n=1 Tax=Rhodovarius crocodyli TaxID=1979269 RepID=A0A437LZ97_9PROT|nr:COQ9 family protein [Rhodovarius crocodyli]RVT90685.1 COQ9 family protein [Rhodovarius crocodyli]
MPEDALLDRVQALVPQLGWTRRALAQAAGDEALALNAFPGGPRDAVAAMSRRADRLMVEDAGELDGLRTPARIRRLIECRLTRAEPHREAVRQAMAVLALPWNAPLGMRLVAETADAMWMAAGDTSSDISRYTRRATLVAVYSATLAFWLRQPAGNMPQVMAFLDRRLAGVARLQKSRPAA